MTTKTINTTAGYPRTATSRSAARRSGRVFSHTAALDGIGVPGLPPAKKPAKKTPILTKPSEDEGTYAPPKPHLYDIVSGPPAVNAQPKKKKGNCCCIVKDLTVDVVNPPVTAMNEWRKITQIIVKITVDYEEHKPNLRCRLEWSEMADNPAGHPYLDRANQWKDIFNTPDGKGSSTFRDWNEKMGFKDKNAKGNFNNPNEGEPDDEWICPQGTITLVDTAKVPTVDTPTEDSGYAPMSRKLDGYIRVYSGCPGKGYAEGRYHQTAEASPKRKAADGWGGPPWPTWPPQFPKGTPDRPPPTNPPRDPGPRVNGPR
jgi:hypothetical protein